MQSRLIRRCTRPVVFLLDVLHSGRRRGLSPVPAVPIILDLRIRRRTPLPDGAPAPQPLLPSNRISVSIARVTVTVAITPVPTTATTRAARALTLAVAAGRRRAAPIARTPHRGRRILGPLESDETYYSGGWDRCNAHLDTQTRSFELPSMPAEQCQHRSNTAIGQTHMS